VPFEDCREASGVRQRGGEVFLVTAGWWHHLILALPGPVSSKELRVRRFPGYVAHDKTQQATQHLLRN
jgi:hypothetical protein